MVKILVVILLNGTLLFSDVRPLEPYLSIVETGSDAVVWNMPRDNRYVALTFDDGPDYIITPQILDVLEEKGVKATFFVVGHMAAKYPHMLQRIHEAGHDIANHTWAHYRLDEMSFDQIQRQLSHTTQAIHQIGVPMANYFRPPGGRYNNFVLSAAKQQGLGVIMWDVNAADYKHLDGSLPSVSATVNRVVRHVKPGSIILMHNSIVAVQALPIIIDQLKQENYEIGLLAWK